MTELAPYRWKITKDHLEAKGSEASDVGMEGPHDLDDNISTNPTHFSLYDDDDILYYEGMLYGDFTGLEPLDDFGMGWAGCTSIKIAGETV